mmetsp:Transcript_14982/g.17861  ORF Transcript_14982/g.17861 Transcript_14982/m.17861 type:complete len:124 (+) Transcript_14982:599-970(+)
MLNKRIDHLKYIFVHADGLQLANLLRFLGYWDSFGYDKPTKYASRVRMEIVRRIDPDPTEDGFYVQFSYDDELVKFPWCDSSKNCPIDKFIEYAAERIILDYEYVDDFCKGSQGTNYLELDAP